MEEVWNNISTPAALQYSLQYSPAAASYRDRAAYLHQDYLQPPRTPPPPHAPHTALTLRSPLEFTYLGSSAVGSGRTAGPPSNSTSSGDDSLHLPTVDTFAFSFPSSTCNRSGRVAPVQASAVGTGDRRQKRMIKNRESAARSRARKQAYTNELELELAQLRRENTMLIKREQDLHDRLALAAQAPDRSTLQRCRSAPAP
ncbi:hypothetical protein QYE76_046737 [Lolium multiflorum]|uniref:BZIP domain-containing protein n=1 Tax=Lolium multiflorum TaxID=4521 RepID=A0AAD8TQF8_LOLMU|nr:hypothetical protein QYE76_046737 [Lolium multiflorum]